MFVALGKRFDHEVMAELLEKLAPGSLPHYFVVQTLASFSSSNREFDPLISGLFAFTLVQVTLFVQVH